MGVAADFPPPFFAQLGQGCMWECIVRAVQHKNGGKYCYIRSAQLSLLFGENMLMSSAIVKINDLRGQPMTFLVAKNVGNGAINVQISRKRTLKIPLVRRTAK